MVLKATSTSLGNIEIDQIIPVTHVAQILAHKKHVLKTLSYSERKTNAKKRKKEARVKNKLVTFQLSRMLHCLDYHTSNGLIMSAYMVLIFFQDKDHFYTLSIFRSDCVLQMAGKIRFVLTQVQVSLCLSLSEAGSGIKKTLGHYRKIIYLGIHKT